MIRCARLDVLAVARAMATAYYHWFFLPVLVLWGTQGFVGRGYQPLSVWQEYAIDVRGEALPTGHFLPEEDPDLVTASLRDFLQLPSASVACPTSSGRASSTSTCCASSPMPSRSLAPCGSA